MFLYIKHCYHSKDKAYSQWFGNSNLPSPHPSHNYLFEWMNDYIINPFEHDYLETEALESVICDVIKICLKRKIATKSGKGNQLINVKTAV